MKSLVSPARLLLAPLCLLQTLALCADDVVLTGWYDFSSAFQAHRASGDAKDSVGEIKNVTGKLWGGDGARHTWRSTDGTYGPTEAVGSTATDGAMSLRVDKDKVYFTITNGTGRNIHLSKVLFDFASVNGNSPRNLSIYYQSGGLSDPNETLLVRWESILNGLPIVSDYEDMELDLSILEDHILGPGQEAIFRFQVDTANVNNQALGLDNIAILGDYADFAVVTYNIRGGKAPSDRSYNADNIRAFRDNYLQGEDVLCLQEVDFQAGEWDGNGVGDKESIKSILSDYPYTYQTVNATTDTLGWFESRHRSSIAILSKHPLINMHEQLIQIDPLQDLWERHAQHVQVLVGQNIIDIFNFHNTYNFNNNDFQYEKAGLIKYRDYVESRLGIPSFNQGDRLIMLGDFNLFHEDVEEIIPSTNRRSNGRDHICTLPLHNNNGIYTTSGVLSDHHAVWAEFDLEAPSPDPMTWAAVPASTSSGAITMEAAAASDPHEVEYYFTNTTIGDGSHDSGWQDSTIYIDSGLTEGATYSYTVMARDKSANANVTGASPSASATTTIVYVAPPYKESFENGIGDWVQSAGDDYDWMVHSGLTPAGMENTPNAGPSGASDGTYYLYAEGHQGQGPYGVASVEANFDFSALTAPAIQFDYHMFGLYIKYLALDVYDGSSWTTDVWRKDNQQHFSISDPWSTALVDLSAYAGLSNVKLRFSTGNKQWFAADPAVDNICIDELPVISYANWEAAAFAAAPSGTDTSFTGNPDMDDWDNEGEWIFGTDPLTMDSPMKEMTHDLVEMSIDYTRRKSTGFNVFAQWSPDLTPLSWDTDGLTEEVTDDDGEVETVTVTVPMNTDQKFVRVKALQN